MRTELEKMLAGELYDPLDPELVRARDRARDLCQDLNATPESNVERRRQILDQVEQAVRAHAIQTAGLEPLERVEGPDVKADVLGTLRFRLAPRDPNHLTRDVQAMNGGAAGSQTQRQRPRATANVEHHVPRPHARPRHLDLALECARVGKRLTRIALGQIVPECG